MNIGTLTGLGSSRLVLTVHACHLPTPYTCLQVVGEVPPPVSDSDVKRFYDYIYDVADNRC